ncbi:MAG: TetR/AcrR family transcriptional regulator [Gemmatimonadetes bacterium]|nr:MAG: TetR/AcrR family transcriptional regulator [Gemmatimonadota bacterium]
MTPRPYRLGRRQAAVDRTRARILTAARALLVARGNTDFSIEAVARRARVTRATVYQRFGSRPKLLEALFDDLALRGGMRDLADAFRRPDPEEALARFIATFGRFWTAHRAIHRRLLALGALDAGLDRALSARQEWRRQGLRVIVGRVRERYGRPAADALDETVDLLFALTSFQTLDVLAGPKRTPAHAAPIVLRVARAILELPV